MKICVGLFLMLILIFSVNTVDADDDWNQKFPEPKPSARARHAMAYIQKNETLLFGGYHDGSYYDDTWVYNLSDNTWTQKDPSSKPPARWAHDIAYIGENKVVLFGGYDVDYRNDTWVYDLSDSTWTQKNPPTKPPARRRHAMAYIGEGKVVLFGGYNGDYKNDTWVYDLSDNNWTQKNPPTKPPARRRHAMAYIGEDKVVLFGGYSGDFKNDTWVYDLSDNNWTQKNPPTKPSARRRHAMAYIGGDGTVLFGGSYMDTFYNDTWAYDLSVNNWSQDMNAIQPSARRAHTLSETSMDGSSYLVLFGGYDGSFYYDETWAFGGGDYPLPVKLSSFTATILNGNVILKWRTETEVKNLGFNIYRSDTKNGKYIKVNVKRIQGAGTDAVSHDYTFTDESAAFGKTYYYYIEDVDFAGNTNRSHIIEVIVERHTIKVNSRPFRSALLQNYPNPFNPDTWLPYELAIDAPVSIYIYNIRGQIVRRLTIGEQTAGSYITKTKAAYWDGRDERGEEMASGVYWYTLQAGNFNATKRMVILK